MTVWSRSVITANRAIPPGPEACDKATRLIRLCDAFGLPLVFLHDAPGFMIGRQVEHGRLLGKAMLMQQAVAMAGVPRLSVIVRKSFGLADHAMSGIGLDSDLLVAWPGAEISFMDPRAAASVLGATSADEVMADPGPYGAAGGMGVDEIIEPGQTRAVAARGAGPCRSAPLHPRDRTALVHLAAQLVTAAIWGVTCGGARPRMAPRSPWPRRRPARTAR